MSLALFLQTVTTLIFLGGLIFAGIQLRMMQAQRMREGALNLMRAYQTLDFVEAVGLLVDLPEGLSKSEIEARLGPNAPKLMLLMLTLENIGLLVYKREVSIEMAEELFTAPVVMAARKLKRYVADTREKAGVETPLEWYEWLANQMTRRRAKCPTPPAYVEHDGWRA